MQLTDEQKRRIRLRLRGHITSAYLMAHDGRGNDAADMLADVVFKTIELEEERA